MSGIIGKGVKDYEIVLSTVKYKIRLIVIFLGLLAQDTSAFCGSLYIFYSPRCPKMFHLPYIVCRFRVERNRILSFEIKNPRHRRIS
jgi:hypothetical protein